MKLEEAKQLQKYQKGKNKSEEQNMALRFTNHENLLLNYLMNDLMVI